MPQDSLGTRMFYESCLLAKDELQKHNISMDIEQFNESGAQSMTGIPELRFLPVDRWMDWTHFKADKADGIFELKYEKDSNAFTSMIRYETDGSGGKEKAYDMSKLVYKMQKGVDLNRCYTRNDRDATFSIRSNLTWCKKKYNSLQKNFVSFLFSIQKSHLFCIFKIISHKIKEVKDTSNMHTSQENDKTYDTHFFIGAFDLDIPHSQKITFKQGEPEFQPQESYDEFDDIKNEKFTHIQNQDFKDMKEFYDFWRWPLMTASHFDQYTEAGNQEDRLLILKKGWLKHWKWVGKPPTKKKKAWPGLDLPYCFVCDPTQPDQTLPGIFTKKYADEWKAHVINDFSTKYMVHSLQLQRVNLSEVKEGGFWYLSDLKRWQQKDFKSNKKRNSRLDSDEDDDEHVSQRVFIGSLVQFPSFYEKRKAKSDKDFWQKKTNLLMQNLNMTTQMDLALLRMLYQGSYASPLSWSIKSIINWNPGAIMNTEQIDWPMRKREIRDKKSQIYSLRSELKDPKEHRSSKSLRSCCEQSIKSSRNSLPDDVEKFLQTMKIPNAQLFLKLVHCPNLPALRELAKQVHDRESDVGQKYKSLIATMPLNTQSELRFMFNNLRSQPDTYIQNAPATWDQAEASRPKHSHPEFESVIDDSGFPSANLVWSQYYQILHSVTTDDSDDYSEENLSSWLHGLSLESDKSES